MYTHTLLKKPGTMCFNFVITLFCVLCLESGKKAQEAWLRVLGLFNGVPFFIWAISWGSLESATLL